LKKEGKLTQEAVISLQIEDSDDGDGSDWSGQCDFVDINPGYY
jgi:hypothetical protein